MRAPAEMGHDKTAQFLALGAGRIDAVANAMFVQRRRQNLQLIWISNTAEGPNAFPC